MNMPTMSPVPSAALPRGSARFPARGLSAALLALLGCASLPAQVVRLVNQSLHPFQGWKRVLLTALPPHPAGWDREPFLVYQVGRQVAPGLHAVDIRVSLEPGAERVVDLAALDPVVRSAPQLPPDPLAYFGGMPMIGGRPMSLVGVLFPPGQGPGPGVPQFHDGAGFTALFRAMLDNTFTAELKVTWYPGQPAWCEAELEVRANLPLGQAGPVAVMNGMRLQWGNAVVFVTGGSPWLPLPAGTTFAPGQSITIPLTLVWLTHVKDRSDWDSIGAAITRRVLGGA